MELLLHDGMPVLPLGQCSAQTLDTSVSFLENDRRKNTRTATTAPRIIILLVAGTFLWAVPNQVGFCRSGLCSEASSWVEESGTGSPVSSLYLVMSLMTLKTGSHTLLNKQKFKYIQRFKDIQLIFAILQMSIHCASLGNLGQVLLNSFYNIQQRSRPIHL